MGKYLSPIAQKRGEGANLKGTSGGAEGDMLGQMLEFLKGEGFKFDRVIIDHDASCQNVIL